jgi:hypothetical protein
MFKGRPEADWVGWCHHCETWQLGVHARHQELWWERGTWDWVCVRCDGEPWGLGVWVCRCRDCANDPEYWDAEPCWKQRYGLCAVQLCSWTDACERHGVTRR